ncbi:S1-C subfamily serine protease [Halanaerobium saccharolyticum]|uniref:S1-C subfamily serine protease n=1 Tax=Halanaerobium saccharolyticum TaxID=43595 RepID=A0A4R7Z728_9FIRM|nr:trypsin-like peptidase domain-containing protein [Halanaerobium saccharolyticum]RAK10520.1 S1-C subfamily serine protease [Halanaerobium saccharolyticum]TDW06723.1 S1-C subfamily serine protease [Halanaerobium saccharolyticum]TDX62358.1 S1-C subfamily serine protease [Halanaerobium saccharolyticum]
MRKNKSLLQKTLLALIIISLIAGSAPAVLAQDQQNQNIYQTDHFADIAEEVNDGVVKVTTTVETSGNQQLPEMFNDPYFRFFFGDRFQTPEQQPRERQGFGSGFIVSEDGYIVTNQHVINDADKIEVEINGIEEPVQAEVAWSDFSLDLAVLKIDTSDLEEELTPLEMGDSEAIRPGQWAIAIGNPLGFEHTVTVGVISATGRPIQIPTAERQVRTYQNLIQLDAAINPGNSGGPLLNNDGQVIGINTAVSRAGQGIGFAIPVNEIKDIVNELENTGEVTRPWIGIAFSEITRDVQEYFNLDNREGVVVIEVYENSPAEEAGLENYDIIKEVDQQKIESTSDLTEIISEKEVGDKIMFKVIRNGNTEVLFGRIGDKPNDL